MLLKGLFQLEHSQDFSNFQLKFHCYKLNVSYMIIIYETLHVKIVKWIGIQLQKKKKKGNFFTPQLCILKDL